MIGITLHFGMCAFRRTVLVLLSASALIGQMALAETPRDAKKATATRPAAEAVKVSLAGVQICSVSDPEEYEDWNVSDFKQPPCTKLLVEIQATEGKLVELDKDASKIESVEDSTGKDLKPKSLDEMFFFFQMAANGKSALVVFDAGEVPSPQATFLRARAKLKFLVGSKKEKIKTPTVAIKKGTKLEVNGQVLTISAVGKTMGGKPSITLSGKKEPAAIASIALLDASGKPLKTSNAGHGRSTTPFGSSWTREIELSRTIEEASFEIEYWTDLKAIEVPVDVKCAVQLNEATK